MAAKVSLTSKLIVEAMQSAAVRKALAEKRDRIARRAETIATNEGIDPHVTTSEGTRPKGRPYARVAADADQEWGNTNTARRRVLGRAAEG